MNQWTVFESNHLLDTTLKSLQVRSDLEVLYWSKFQNEKAIMSIQQTIYIKETVCLTHQVLMPKNEKWSFERNVTCIETQRKAIEILTFLLMKSQILLMRITDPLSNWKMMATILQIPKTFQTKKNRTIISQIKIKSRNNHHKNKTKEINNSKIRTKRKTKETQKETNKWKPTIVTKRSSWNERRRNWHPTRVEVYSCNSKMKIDMRYFPFTMTSRLHGLSKLKLLGLKISCYWSISVSLIKSVKRWSNINEYSWKRLSFNIGSWLKKAWNWRLRCRNLSS